MEEEGQTVPLPIESSTVGDCGAYPLAEEVRREDRWRSSLGEVLVSESSLLPMGRQEFGCRNGEHLPLGPCTRGSGSWSGATYDSVEPPAANSIGMATVDWGLKRIKGKGNGVMREYIHKVCKKWGREMG